MSVNNLQNGAVMHHTKSLKCLMCLTKVLESPLKILEKYRMVELEQHLISCHGLAAIQSVLDDVPSHRYESWLKKFLSSDQAHQKCDDLKMEFKPYCDLEKAEYDTLHGINKKYEMALNFYQENCVKDKFYSVFVGIEMEEVRLRCIGKGGNDFGRVIQELNEDEYIVENCSSKELGDVLKLILDNVPCNQTLGKALNGLLSENRRKPRKSFNG